MKKIFTLLTLCVFAVVSCQPEENTLNVDTHMRIFSIVPAIGETGSSAIISGVNFSDAVQVKVGGKEAQKVSVSDNRIQIILPQNAIGTYPVTLSRGDEYAEGADYTYVEDGKAKMALVNMVPSSGFVGTETVIYGQGFGDSTGDLHVFFDDVEGQVTFSTRNIIHVKAPQHALGESLVTVRNSEQEAGTLRYTYRAEPVFQLLSVVPESGKAGTTVTLTGELFSKIPSENIVTINGVPATVVTATTEKLTITIPENPEGTYPIHLKVGDKETEGLAFTYPPKTWIINYFVGNGVNEELKEGIGTAASVHFVQDIVPAPDGKLWLVCRNKHSIMTVDKATGEVRKLVTDATNLNNLWQGAFNSQGVFFAAVKGAGKLATVTQNGVVSVYNVTQASGSGTYNFNQPMTLCFDGNDTMYVGCRDLATGATEIGGIVKVVNGKVSATWSAPDICTIALGPDNKLYWGRNSQKSGWMGIYCTDPSTGNYTRIAGNGNVPTAETFSNGEPGKPLTATVNIVRDICFCADGSMLFTEENTATLRRLKPLDGDYTKGTINVVAGTPLQPSQANQGNYDGTLGPDARLSSNVYGVWAEPDMSAIYLADGFNCRVNKLVTEE